MDNQMQPSVERRDGNQEQSKLDNCTGPSPECGEALQLIREWRHGRPKTEPILQFFDDPMERRKVFLQRVFESDIPAQRRMEKLDPSVSCRPQPDPEMSLERFFQLMEGRTTLFTLILRRQIKPGDRPEIELAADILPGREQEHLVCWSTPITLRSYEQIKSIYQDVFGIGLAEAFRAAFLRCAPDPGGSRKYKSA